MGNDYPRATYGGPRDATEAVLDPLPLVGPVEDLVTHSYDISQATQAYQLIEGDRAVPLPSD